MKKPDSKTAEAWQRGRWGVSTFNGLPVYLFCRGGEIDGLVIDADLLAADLHERSGGQIPYDIEICCPRCGEKLNISGGKKTVHVDRREPLTFAHPHDGEPVVQTVVVTIEEALTCSQTIGKTICGLAFRIDENVVHKV